MNTLLKTIIGKQPSVGRSTRERFDHDLEQSLLLFESSIRSDETPSPRCSDRRKQVLGTFPSGTLRQESRKMPPL